jgi:hypothetical protein
MDEVATAALAAARGRWTQWEEVVVSNDRGSRLVHYYLRGNGEAKELAVVGRERSPRHMSYAVQGRFLRALAAAAGAVAVASSPSRSPLAAAVADGGAPRRWRSRREVVEWLSSLVSGKFSVPGLCLLDLVVDFDDFERGLARLVLFLARFGVTFCVEIALVLGPIEGGSCSGSLLFVFGAFYAVEHVSF